MVVIVEGIDRVGKTTLVDKLKKAGFKSFKDNFNVDLKTLNSFSDYSIGKIDTTLKIVKDAHDNEENIVIDRLHLTEQIYGILERHEANTDALLSVDNFLKELNALIVYVKPTNIDEACDRANKNLIPHHILFEQFVWKSRARIIAVDFDNLDSIVEAITYEAFDYDFYFASPFFTDEQIEREERMIRHLRTRGYKVFSPKESCLLTSDASSESRKKVFDDNVESIKKSRGIFCITDGKDIGTIWEAGYAYALNKPIIYFAETLKGNNFNVMLAESGVKVFTKQDDATKDEIDKALSGSKSQYEGMIE